MGMFSMCPSCGSDYCTGCECVKEKYAAILGFVMTIADIGISGDPENYRTDAQKLMEDFNKADA